MRALLPIVALISCTLAAPSAINPLLAIDNQDTQPLFEAITQPGLVAAEPAVIETNQTIYIYLSQQLRYTKLVKLIDFDEEYVTILNSTTDRITFFAPDNDALKPPKKKEPHDSSISLVTLYEEYEQLNSLDDDDDDDEEKKKWFKKILHALLKYHTFPTALNKPELFKNATYGTALKAKDGSFDGQPRRVAMATSNWPFGSIYVNYYAKVEWATVSAVNGYLYGINRPLFPFPSILDELFFVDEFSTLTSALQKVGLEDQLQWKLKASSETQGDGPVVSLFAPTNKAWKRLPLRLRYYLFSPAGEKALRKLLKFHIVPKYILHSDWLHNATSDEDLTSNRQQLKHECSCGGDWYNDIKGVYPFHHKHSDEPTVKQTLKDKLFTLIKTKLNLKRSNSEEPHRRCRVRNGRLARVAAPAIGGAWPRPRPPPPNVTVNTTIPTLLDDQELRFVVIKPTDHRHYAFALPVDSDDPDTPPKPPSVSIPPFFRSVVLANGIPAEVEIVARNGALYSIGHVIHPKKGQDDDEIENSWDDWEEWLPAWAEQD